MLFIQLVFEHRFISAKYFIKNFYLIFYQIQPSSSNHSILEQFHFTSKDRTSNSIASYGDYEALTQLVKTFQRFRPHRLKSICILQVIVQVFRWYLTICQSRSQNQQVEWNDKRSRRKMKHPWGPREGGFHVLHFPIGVFHKRCWFWRL